MSLLKKIFYRLDIFSTVRLISRLIFFIRCWTKIKLEFPRHGLYSSSELATAMKSSPRVRLQGHSKTPSGSFRRASIVSCRDRNMHLRRSRDREQERWRKKGERSGVNETKGGEFARRTVARGKKFGLTRATDGARVPSRRVARDERLKV